MQHHASDTHRPAHIFSLQAATRRKNTFTKAGVPNLAEAVDARVTIFRPLQIGSYGVIVMDSGLMIGHGELAVVFCNSTTTQALTMPHSHCIILKNWRQKRETRCSHRLINNLRHLIPRGSNL